MKYDIHVPVNDPHQVMQSRVNSLQDAALKEAMMQLIALEFTDFDKCLMLCRKYNNNMERVVDDLL